MLGMHPLRNGFTAQRYIGTRSGGKPQVIGENKFGLHYIATITTASAEHAQIEIKSKIFANQINEFPFRFQM